MTTIEKLPRTASPNRLKMDTNRTLCASRSSECGASPIMTGEHGVVYTVPEAGDHDQKLDREKS